jgi:hypothetical protein
MFWSSELTTKAAKLQGDSAVFVPSLCVAGLGPVVARARVWFTRYFIVAPMALPAAMLNVRRRFLTAAPWLMPAASRRHLIVVPRQMNSNST